jgi:signal transduction histidine kinase
VAVAEIDLQLAAELGGSAGRAGELVQLAREALSNVGRHAGAATCRLSLYRRDGAAVLEVDDDGRGFDPAATPGTGHGLPNLRGRAEGLGGRLEIASGAGQGTTIRVLIPV